MRRLKKEFVERREVEFIFDDDASFSWLHELDSTPYDRIFVFLDKNVEKHWGEVVQTILNESKKRTEVLRIEATELSKSADFFPKAIQFLEGHRCGRYDLVIAVGGGIVLDLAGFVVSTYMRGLPLFFVPTTLIGQIDASTAGKTCLNTSESKNLLGTFYYPEVVYNNICFLNTNAPRILRQGFSEMFKYGLLGSREIISKMLEYDLNSRPETLSWLIEETAKVRIGIREKHPLVSNLGHTFGHAIEKLSGYEILHGDAISSGIVLAMHFSVTKGIMSRSEVDEVFNLMKKLGLNVWMDPSWKGDDLVLAMARDKKSSSKLFHLVLIEGIERPYEQEGQLFRATDPEEVKEFLDQFLPNYGYLEKQLGTFLMNHPLSYDERNEL